MSGDMPDGRVGEVYLFQFDADCDNDTWTLISGSLPPGLSLSPQGELSGVPTLAGTFVFTVGVGGSGDSEELVSKGFSLLIVQPVGTLAITTSTPRRDS